MKRRLFLAIAIVIFALTNLKASTITPHYGEVKNGYNFWFYNPDETESKDSRPVIIFLHGSSLCGTNLNKVKRYGTIDAIEKGHEIDAYVIAPQNPGGAWKPEKVMRVVEWAQQNYKVDANRIYVLGMSLGGYGTLDMCAAYPDKIAAAMAFCGGSTSSNYSGLSKVPLWIVHGTADAAVSVSQSDKVVNGIKASGDNSRLIYNRVPGMNHSRPARYFYLKESYDWLMSHSLADAGREVNQPTFSPEQVGKNYASKGKKSVTRKHKSKRQGIAKSKSRGKKSSGRKNA
jgi:predicted peptidase